MQGLGAVLIACTVALAATGSWADTATEKGPPGAQGGPMPGARGAARPEDYFREAFLLYRKNLDRGAVIRFRQGLKGKADDGLAHLYLAHALRRLGDAKRAAAHYRRTIALLPGSKQASEAQSALAALPPSATMGIEAWRAERKRLEAARRARQREEAKRLLPAALRIAGRIEEQGWRDPAYASIAKAYLNLGDLAAARQAALRGEMNVLYLLRKIAEAYAKAGDVEGVTKTANAVDESQERAYVFNVAIDAMTRAGNLDGAAAVVERLDGGNARPWGLASIAEAYLEKGRIEEARAYAARWAEATDDFDGDKEDYYRAQSRADLAAVQARTGDREKAGDMLARALDGLDDVDEPADRANVLVPVMRAYIALGDDARADASLARALETVQRIEDPWTRGWTRGELLMSIGRAAGRAGDTARLRTAFAAAVQAQMAKDEKKRSKVAGIARIAESRYEAGDVDGARENFATAAALADQVRKKDDRVEALVDLLEARNQAGDHEGAMETAQAALEIIPRIRIGDKRSSAISSFAREVAQIDDLAAARTLLETAAGHAKSIRRTADRLPPPFYRADALASVARWQYALGDGNRARANIAEAHRIARTIKSARDRLSALLEIVEAQALGGDRAGARETMPLVREAATALGDHAIIARAHAYAGELDGALRHANLIGSMKDMTLKDIVENVAETLQ